jgi:hypothetical protein
MRYRILVSIEIDRPAPAISGKRAYPVLYPRYLGICLGYLLDMQGIYM